MKHALTLCLALLAAPGFAGDAAKGEKDFKKCKSCHTIANGDDVIFKGGRTGPNLFGIIGRTAGSYEGFKYSKDMKALGESGYVWTEEDLAIYVADPKAFLRERTGNSKARSKMTFKLKKAENVAAYLATLGE